MPGTRARATCLVACIVLAGLVHADTVYRWTDRDGITHYGDRAPRDATAKVTAIRVAAEPEPVARLRIESADGRFHAYADNLLAGPIEVMLEGPRGRALVSDPALPARATVPARGSALVAVIEPDGRPGRIQMDLQTVPGAPAAQPRDVEYAMPLRVPRVRIDQGHGGRFSHTDMQNRHALDFAADVGTVVQAARAGTVMQVASGFDRSGLDAKYTGRANFIRIVHEDGTMALYAHLDTNGVHVRPGQRVQAGQQIGLSGNTGYSTGPHLHFVVQANRGMRLESVPVRITGLVDPAPDR